MASHGVRGGVARAGGVKAWAALVVALLAASLFVGPLGPRAASVDVSWPTTAGVSLLTLLITGLATVLLVRRPGHRIGRVLAALATLMAFSSLSDFYFKASYESGMDPLPGAVFFAWSTTWGPVSFWLCIALLLLLFPDGAPASPRWRVVVFVTVGLFVGTASVATVTPGRLGETGPVNPLGWEVVAPFGATLGTAFWIGFNLAVMVAASSLLFRYRRARGLERQQLKWLALSGVLIVVGGVAMLLAAGGAVGWVVPVAGVVFGGGLVSVPVFAVLAILRYRLYDLDRIISRTLSYALVTGVLGGVYAVAVFVASPAAASLGGDSQIAVAAATLAVAVAFRPVRRLVQAAVDRRFNRGRYDGERTIRAFADRLREAVDVDEVRADLLATAVGVVQPSSAQVWLRRDSGAG